MVRRARPQDAAAIAALQLRAWWHAYGDYVDHDKLAAHTLASRTERWTEILTRRDGDRGTTLVADVEGRVAGFVAVGPVQHAEPEPGLGELLAIYVDPPAQGAGVGRALLAGAEDELRAAGYERAVLCVFEQNGLARAFYAAQGWRPEEPLVIVEDLWAPEVRYRKELR